MANQKTIRATYTTGKTVYCIVEYTTEAGDPLYLHSSLGSFLSFNSYSYNTMSEHNYMKGLYELLENRSVWADGKYIVSVYCQSGASPSPANDILIGAQEFLMVNDTEVQYPAATTALLSGLISVTHNYGGTGNLSYKTDSGTGIEGANVFAYKKADYDAGNRGNAYVKGNTTTDSAGNWVSPMFLSAGTYTFVYIKSGEYGPDTKEVTIS